MLLGCLEEVGVGRNVQNCMIGYVIQSSRGRAAGARRSVSAWDVAGEACGGLVTKMRWWLVRCSVPFVCSPRRDRTTSSTCMQARVSIYASH
jgi:hypothetical protein